MSPEQHNRLVEHSRALLADAKWRSAATFDSIKWAQWWAGMALRPNEQIGLQSDLNEAGNTSV